MTQQCGVWRSTTTTTNGMKYARMELPFYLGKARTFFFIRCLLISACEIDCFARDQFFRCIFAFPYSIACTSLSARTNPLQFNVHFLLFCILLWLLLFRFTIEWGEPVCVARIFFPRRVFILWHFFCSCVNKTSE